MVARNAPSWKELYDGEGLVGIRGDDVVKGRVLGRGWLRGAEEIVLEEGLALGSRT